MGLYVHVPFCRSLCRYCAFAKGEFDPAAADGWLRALQREFTVRAERSWTGRPRLETVFLGGGTPSVLGPDRIRVLGDLLDRRFVREPDAEFTSEANPESFTPEVAAALRDIGVNRVSLGAQSMRPEELALLGRVHGPEAPGRALDTARAAGFAGVNLDLMYGLPGQEPDDFARSLDAVLALEPDHLSAYCLGLEPGTPLAEDVAAGRIPRPEDDTARALFDHLESATDAAGLASYEISNFARPGQESRHNLRYWRRQDVLAAGPSAHGLARNRRWVNPAPLAAWTAAYRGGRIPVAREVPGPEARFETVFLALRLREGLDLEEYARRFGVRFEEEHGAVLRRLVAGELLEHEGTRVRLAPRARFLSDGVFAEFAPDGNGG